MDPSLKNSNSVLLDIDGKTFKIPALTEDKSISECLKRYMPLPDSITFTNSDSQHELNQMFMIPSTDRYEHTVDYSPPTTDAHRLRILVSGRPNTKILLYLKGDLNDSSAVNVYNDPLFDSFTMNQGQDTILIAKDLKYGRTYQLAFEFGPDRN